MPSGPLAGKLAIVTASSRGIGAAIATKLARSGASILLNYVSDSSAKPTEEFAARLRKDYGVQAATYQGDMQDCLRTAPGLIKAAVDSFSEHHTNPKTGKLQIDIIVHNAAACDWAPISHINHQNFDKHYHLNVLCPILIQQEATPYLPNDRSGRIIFISSSGAKMGPMDMSLYTGSKAAVEGMVKVWAKEIATRATVNVVSPGPTETEAQQAAPEALRQYLKPWVSHAPLAQPTEEEMATLSEENKKTVGLMGGRWAHASEIADIVYLVALPESGWMTGQTFDATGGMF